MQVITFCIDVQVEYGKAAHLVHSQNDWQLNTCSRMKFIKQSEWELTLDIYQSNFEYKFAIGDYDDVTNDSNVIWENGPNRFIKLDDIKQNNIKQKWGKTRITIKFPQIYQNSLMIILGDFNSFQSTMQMKLRSKHGQKYFYRSVDVDLKEKNQSIQFQYYLLTYGRTPKEYISKSICLPVSDSLNLQPSNVQFFQLSN